MGYGLKILADKDDTVSWARVKDTSSKTPKKFYTNGSWFSHRWQWNPILHHLTGLAQQVQQWGRLKYVVQNHSHVVNIAYHLDGLFGRSHHWSDCQQKCHLSLRKTCIQRHQKGHQWSSGLFDNQKLSSVRKAILRNRPIWYQCQQEVRRAALGLLQNCQNFNRGFFC